LNIGYLYKIITRSFAIYIARERNFSNAINMNESNHGFSVK